MKYSINLIAVATGETTKGISTIRSRVKELTCVAWVCCVLTGQDIRLCQMGDERMTQTRVKIIALYAVIDLLRSHV